jgi:endonuclease/exonuclease/phosphatase family metal-dependent hydrolase
MVKHPRWTVPVLILAPAVGLALALAGCPPPPGPAGDGAAAGDGYLFCHWNVENLFDDKLNDYTHSPDREYDTWFAENADVRRKKLDNLSRVLTRLNNGRGPDILAVVEVESQRAAELLQQALNDRLPEELRYTHVLMEEVSAGRHMAPAILTRLQVDADRTRLLDKRRRILEGHVLAGDQELVVIASHWTSRVSSKTDEEGEGRDKYASEIYGRFRALFKRNPDVDLVVCGDFNDDPDDESVRDYLHAVGDPKRVRAGGPEPLLLDLFADVERKTAGTLWHRGKWNVFDQIVVSPGMLDDRGWGCDPASARIVNDLTADRRGHPMDFGDERDKVPLEERGYSDHFPVTVRLRVQGR